MSVDLQQKIQQIQDRANQKSVFIVEGEDDKLMWEHWFSKYQPNWATRWHIDCAGNKKQVVEMLKCEKNWFGIVDKDEWQPEKISKMQQSVPNLHILPRFCSENYLIVPSEIWQALSENQQNKIAGGFDEFSVTLLSQLEKYLKHGAWWCVINPLWEGLRSKGFKEDLLNIQHTDNLEYIRAKLHEWHDYLNPQAIEQRYDNQLIAARNRQPERQLHQDIHGKVFFENVVCHQFNQWFGQQKQNKLRRELVKRLSLPDDINSILIQIIS